MSTMFNPDKEKYEISVWEDYLVLETVDTEGKVILEHFEEQKIATIGAHDMDTPYAAMKPMLTRNVNGSFSLSFSMYYKVYDEQAADYLENPFIQFLENERKLKLCYRNKWYDLIIKNCVEDSSTYTFNYTAKSFYANELNKNGFKVELDSELENNQGTITELGKTILSGTDWEIDEDKSDLIVQTNIEPLYCGVINQDIEVELVSDYVPDETEKPEVIRYIEAGKTVLFFYSDINNNEPQPQILFREDGEYTKDINEDIITNSYNYRIISPKITYSDMDFSYNVPNIVSSETESGFTIYNRARGEKVVRNKKTGYDPDLDKFIVHYKDEKDKKYYGYEKIDSLSSNLTQNFLANSESFSSINAGWVFDGTPSKNNSNNTENVINNEDATFTGQIYLLNDDNFSYEADEVATDTVMVMRLKEDQGKIENKTFYQDSNGEYYKIIQNDKVKYIEVDSVNGKTYEESVRADFQNKKANGDPEYANKTEKEIDALIDASLRGNRYSIRKKVAINTGVAANRKVIENFSSGEEYVFATSLGKYKENQQPPEYGREIRYGATAPKEIYQFIKAQEGDETVDIKTSTYTLNEDTYAIAPENTGDYYVYKDDNGFYVLEDGKLRLFDRAKDTPKTIYLPVKNSEGDYVYDHSLYEGTGGYRKYRNWRSDVLKDGNYGDIIYHTWKAFDGKLGDYEEKPPRYDLKITHENLSNRKYLEKENNGFPVGYQLDYYVRDDNNGEYVIQDSGSSNKTLTERFLDLFKIKSNDSRAVSDDLEKIQFQIDFTKLSGLNLGVVGEWLSNKINNFIGFNESVLDTIFGGKIIKEALKSLGIDFDIFGKFGISTKNINSNTEEDVYVTATKIDETGGSISNYGTAATNVGSVNYVKYRFWYYKHWNKPRYTLLPKLCIKTIVDSDEEFKIYNNVEDADVTNFFTISRTKEEDEEYQTATLINRSYRSLEAKDFSASKFIAIALDNPVSDSYVKDEILNIYRPIDKSKDLQYEFGKGWWVQAYKFEEISVDLDNGENYFMLVNGNYIPYNENLFRLSQERYSRVRISPTDEDLTNSSEHYVYANGIYSTIKKYYNDNTKILTLNYNGLKVYFTPNYKYDAEHFAIEEVQGLNENTKNPEYMGITINTSPDGYFDTDVIKDSILEETIKERWAYWKMPVIKGFSLIEDVLSSVGIVFEKDSSIKREEDFPFLGMQFFKYIEYKAQEETEVKSLIVPGQAPDAKDLTIKTYYIYEPEQSSSVEDIIYSYVGQYPEENGYFVEYDETCSKIRSIKGKESNYFKLLQDCCETFDCWMEQDIEHDNNTGKVIYVEKPVYKQKNTVEPQIYIGELPEGINEDDYECQGYIKTPSKKIYFKRYVGKSNDVGFKYGVNLKHIKRTVDSESITSRIIVKPNQNEFAVDNFCTIQRAKQNILGENFLYDFTYYINKGLLNYTELNEDLYSSSPNKMGYYVKIARLNKENQTLINNLSSILIELDRVNARYETASLGRDAAQEEIAKLTEILKNNYDTYGNLIDNPWTQGKSKEYVSKIETTSQETKTTLINADGEEYEVTIPSMTTVLEYPKYNDTLRNYFDQMDVYQKRYSDFSKEANLAKADKERLETERDNILKRESEIVEKKNELNKLFYHKYSRFIQEGSWTDQNYIDDDLYYLDALAVLRTSCVPKVTYDIGVVDLYDAVEYEEDRKYLDFELGDRTYVEDVEFFGYMIDGSNRPYHEIIVVSEKIDSLEDVSANQIKVKNYSTQFDTLFQRIAATSQTLQFNEGKFGMVSSILDKDGSINTDKLQEALDNASFVFKNSINEDVYWDNTGIWVKSYKTDANILRLTSMGIGLSIDGGNTYMTAITGAGINAAAITSGMLNIDNLLIGAKSAPNFLWNKFGISSFKTLEDGIDYSTFVRLDQYGVYGIKNWSKDGMTPEQMSINDAFEPLRLSDITENDNAVFGLTWDGFFLNTGTDTDRGRVTIGTNQDIRMSVKDDSGWRDRVIIGRMTDIFTNQQTYGFRLVNEDGEIVMDTNLQGELYLKRKLRISNFTNETKYDQRLEYTNYYCIFTRGEVKYKIYLPFDQYKKIYETVEIAGNRIFVIDNKILPENEDLESMQFIEIYEFSAKTILDIGEYNSLTEKEKANYKAYFVFNEKGQQEEEVIIRNIKNNIINPGERVTLGIVDVYDRRNDYIKTNISGQYDSSHFLTKVFSVKVNESVGIEQFTQDILDKILDESENFAIFDNGNLYAKNAWIEGNIRATSGAIIGQLTIGDEEGQIIFDGYDELSIYSTSTRGSWKIGADGTAYFNNVNVSGKISSAIFEYNKVQTVGGAMFLRPTVDIVQVIESITENGYIYELVLSKENQNPPDFGKGSICQLGIEGKIETGNNYKIYGSMEEAINALSATNTMFINNTTESSERLSSLFIVSKTKIKDISEKVSLYSVSPFVENIDGSFSYKNTCALSLNASDAIGTLIPSEGFSIVELNYNNEMDTIGSIVRAKLGKLSDLSITDLEGYGLYCDNIYVHGTIITNETDRKFEAGMSSKRIRSYNDKGLIFWAGAFEANNEGKIINGVPTFYVNEDGKLFAHEGYFSGTIEASKIISAEIYGNGDYGLKIYSDDKIDKDTRAIWFGDKYKGNNGEEAEKEYFTLTASLAKFSTDIKIVNSDNKELFSIFSNESQIGMFNENGSNINNYLLSFRKEEGKEIAVYYKNQKQMVFTSEGVKFNDTNNQSSHGENAYIISVDEGYDLYVV